MNGQVRGSNDTERIFLPDVKTLEDYRGYKKILFVRPFAGSYMGYLEDSFFGFTVPKEQGVEYWLMDIKEAVDYYIDRVPFKIPDLEYDTFVNRKEYAPSVKLLKMVKDGNRVTE